MAHSPYQKRLLWLLNTFGKKYPREVSDTVQMLLLVEPTLRYGPAHRRWYAKTTATVTDRWVSLSDPDPVQTLKTFIEGVEAPTRSPFDRWGRWLLGEVRRAYRTRPKALSAAEAAKFYSSLSGLVNPFKRPGGSGRVSYTADDVRRGYRTPKPATRKELAVQRKLQKLWLELPAIREWLGVTGASLKGLSVARASRAAACWHAAAIESAMSEAQRRAGLAGGITVGKLSEGWSLLELTTREELAAEGSTLHHCVGSYWAHVNSGRQRIYSLRDPSNTPRATFSVVPYSGATFTGEVQQAKGLHNAALGFPAGRHSDNAHASLQELEKKADLQVLAIALQAMSQHPEWKWRPSRDMHGVLALERALIKEEKKKKGLPGRGHRASHHRTGTWNPLESTHLAGPGIRRSVGLSYGDAAKLLARSKKPYNGVALAGGLRLYQETRYGTPSHHLPHGEGPPTPIYAIRTKKPEEWWTKTGKEKTTQRHGYDATLYEYERQWMPTSWALVEIWPDRWVVRGRVGSLRRGKSSGSRLTPHAFPGAQYSPLTLIRPKRRLFDSDARPPLGQVGATPTRLIAVARQKHVTPRVAGAYRAPDWAFWELRLRKEELPPNCGVLAITVNKYGVPTAVRCEEARGLRHGEFEFADYWSKAGQDE
jgi:hypothetical protein